MRPCREVKENRSILKRFGYIWSKSCPGVLWGVQERSQREPRRAQEGPGRSRRAQWAQGGPGRGSRREPGGEAGGTFQISSLGTLPRSKGKPIDLEAIWIHLEQIVPGGTLGGSRRGPRRIPDGPPGEAEILSDRVLERGAGSKSRENDAKKLAANATRRLVRPGPGKGRWRKKGAQNVLKTKPKSEEKTRSGDSSDRALERGAGEKQG